MLYKLLSFLNLDLDGIFNKFINSNLDITNSQSDTFLDMYKRLYVSLYPKSSKNSWRYNLVGKLITRSKIMNPLILI